MTSRSPDESPDPMQPPRCHARSKRTGEPCGNRPMRGATVCRMHGGSSQAVRRKAAQRVAATEARRMAMRLGGALEVHPLDALLRAVWEAAHNVEVYRSLVATLEPAVGEADERVVAVGERDIYSSRGVTHVPARPHIFVVMYDAALERLAKFSKMCLDAGVDERRVRIAEQDGRRIAEVVAAALEASDASPEGRRAALEAAAAMMRPGAEPVAVVG